MFSIFFFHAIPTKNSFWEEKTSHFSLSQWLFFSLEFYGRWLFTEIGDYFSIESLLFEILLLCGIFGGFSLFVIWGIEICRVDLDYVGIVWNIFKKLYNFERGGAKYCWNSGFKRRKLVWNFWKFGQGKNFIIKV